ncbi:MAG: CoA transferase [Pseudotabrizicola sp.]|uniref:CaiB/BaiF CoA transferase family protein n=1 Tax=Pseudotabrizicola sp. TaxID=2939647 RepID=UPI0027315E0D|nr:CoA transferase [Pseudotabrizicola sp.]MDP2081308.1 CoA transferase [Pseudotabrizicola sp.]MDZ7576073.1 CoA transferase [Pseudotabrizicola sp.]
MLPLEGIRVVELTTAWAGPMAGRILSWFGAESFHIESPTRTNTWRSNRDRPNPVTYPDLDPGARPWDRCFTFNSQNLNKRSLVVDLKNPMGFSVVRRLVAQSDVLICNFRPGLLERLGLDHATLSKDHPGLIVIEMPAYGLTGPDAGFAALGPTMEMAAGMSAMIGYPGGQPTVTGPSYMDPIGGFNAAAALLTALHHRDRTGQGQHIEMAQVEGAMQFIGPELIEGADVPPDGNRRADIAPHNAYPALGDDSWVAIAARSDAEWSVLSNAVGGKQLVQDPRFVTLAARKANEDALDDLIAAWTRLQDRHAIASHLQAIGVAASAVETAPDLARSDYLRTRGFFTTLDHPVAGRHDHPGLPFHSDIAQGSARTASPGFGEGNDYVLRDVLALSEAEIAQIMASGALADTPEPGT